MAAGILGALDVPLAGGIAYTVPALNTKVATININLCNRTAAAITVDVALSAAATPLLGEYIEFGVTIPANSVLERTACVMGPNHNVYVKPAAIGISCLVTGFEEA